MAFVYILKLANDQYYVGSTYNLPHRIREHNNGQDFFTRRFLPVELKYFEEYETKEEAAKRERQIKGFRQSAKVAHEGGKIVGETRAKIESQTGRSIVSKERASDYLPPADRWESLPEDDKDK